MNLSEHFTLEEFTFSSTAVRLGIVNKPSDEVLINLQRLARGMEQVRILLKGNPVHIDSAYRCEELNACVGGSKTSAHMQGHAADFVCPQFGNPRLICAAIMQSPIVFDQMIYEGTWVHISFDPRNRMQKLIAMFTPSGARYEELLGNTAVR